jgi:hypothetical protein
MNLSNHLSCISIRHHPISLSLIKKIPIYYFHDVSCLIIDLPRHMVCVPLSNKFDNEQGCTIYNILK